MLCDDFLTDIVVNLRGTSVIILVCSYSFDETFRTMIFYFYRYIGVKVSGSDLLLCFCCNMVLLSITQCGDSIIVCGLDSTLVMKWVHLCVMVA